MGWLNPTFLQVGEEIPFMPGMLYRVADGKISMEDARHKHHQLLKRQHFGREPPPIRPPF